MRKIDIPKLKFSIWYPWKNRSEFPSVKCPGVYIIAISLMELQDKKPSFSDVNYAGMTVSKGGLEQRWRSFDQAITNGKKGHSGGITVFEKLGPYREWKKELFVSACTIKADFQEKTSEKNLIIKGMVAYLEYKTLAEVFKETGEIPKFNKLGK